MTLDWLSTSFRPITGWGDIVLLFILFGLISFLIYIWIDYLRHNSERGDKRHRHDDYNSW